MSVASSAEAQRVAEEKARAESRARQSDALERIAAALEALAARAGGTP